MKLVTKKLLSMLLTVCLSVAFVPFTALAEVPEAPTLVSADVTTGGDVGLTFNKEMKLDGVVDGFKIIGADGAPKRIINATLHGGDNNFIQLYLDPTIKGGDVPRLEYTPGTVKAADGGVLEAIHDYKITNNQAYPILDKAVLPVGLVGSPYSHSFTATGGTEVYTFSCDADNLPDGLSMDTEGKLSGTLTAAGSFTFQIRVVDAKDAFDSKEFTITVAENVCEIDGIKHSDLDAALASVGEGENKTITLLKSIDYEKGMIINGKRIDFNLNGKNLNVTNTSGVGLDVMNGYAGYDGAGEFNVTGTGIGVRVNNSNSIAIVSNATATAGNGTGVYADKGTITVNGNTEGGYSGATAVNPGSQITVMGDAEGTAVNGTGVWANIGGKITVNGTAQGVLSGALAQGTGSTVIVKDAWATGASGAGAKATDGGKITIDGTIIAANYISMNDVVKGKGEGEEDLDKPDYLKYTDGSNIVWVKDTPVPVSYSVTVQNDGNGIGSADPNPATEKSIVTLTSIPNNGYHFKEWQAVSGNVSISDNSFTMPANAVTVKAVFEKNAIPPAQHSVTVQNDGNGTASAGPARGLKGTVVTLSAAPNNGYHFKVWRAVTPANLIINNGSFIMPDEDVTVKALFEKNSGSSGGGSGSSGRGSSSGGASSSGGSYTTTLTVASEKRPDQPVTVNAALTPTMDKNGHASAIIPQKSVTDAIAKALVDAKVQNKSANGIGVTVMLKTPATAKSFEIVLTHPTMKNLTDAKVQLFEVNGRIASLNLNLEALKEIQKQNTGDVTIIAKPTQSISEEGRALIGNRPAYEITFTYADKNGKTQTITNLGGGSVTLSLPYTPGKNEAVGQLFAVYVDGRGKATLIPGSAYDANSKSVIFSTNHFSVYGIGYIARSAKFTDTSTHWAKESIDYVVGRGLFSGTSDTSFSPNTAMSRGVLVAALGRLTGMDVSSYKTSSFADVKIDSYYLPYIEWAHKNGIIQGVGGNQFAPDRAVTREEIAVILSKYTKATGYTLPVTREAVIFSDNSGVSSYAKDAVKAVQQAGIMTGEQSSKFNPKASATRAEVASTLYRYVKLTIDPVTAQGWAKNADGQWMYYKDGKVLTGWQTIGGVRYSFDANGLLQTGWVKDGDKWYFFSENTRLTGWWNNGSDKSKKRYYFTKDGIMVSGKWLEIDEKWYYFNVDGSLAVNTKIEEYEVDKNGVRKAK